MNSSVKGSSPKITFPTELIIIILETFIDIYPCSSQPVLLVSKTFYHLLLPRVYHTLDFAGDTGKHARHGIDRTVLLACANPASLGYVRRLKCNIYASHFTLSSFSNLTFLALWGGQNLTEQPSVASALTTVPLQELIVWSERDNRALLKETSPSSTIFHTLQRLTTYSSFCCEPAPGWLQCKNLSHILALCRELGEIGDSAVSKLHTNQRLVCYGIGFPVSKVSKPDNEILRDRRVVVLHDEPAYLYHHGTRFWTGIASVWDHAEKLIRENSDPRALFNS
ncbi:hypothetical protein DL96DRAFT_1627594 [Flagelloscypha sp. PMI_526]|nr:hypothetical protein DL96DRAFT_1627594 [Flagelloscypha sp. PMI_526]